MFLLIRNSEKAQQMNKKQKPKNIHEQRDTRNNNNNKKTAHRKDREREKEH